MVKFVNVEDCTAKAVKQFRDNLKSGIETLSDLESANSHVL